MIGFFTGSFGALSETFVTKEYHLLRSLGINLKSICLRSYDETNSSYVLQKNVFGLLNVKFFVTYVSAFGFRDSIYLALRFKSFNRLIINSKISHLHVHWENQIKMGFVAWRLKLIKSYSISWHASDLLEFGRGLDLVIKDCDHNFVCNGHSYDFLNSYTENCSLVYHGLDTTRLDRYKVSREKRDKYFVFLGRLIESKGISVIISAFERNGLNLKIIGPGNSYKSTPNIEFLGPLEHMSAIKMLANSQGLIFGGNALQGRGGYGLPNVILESCHLDIPVFSRELNEYDVVERDSINIWNDIDTLNSLLSGSEYRYPKVKKVLNQDVTNARLIQYLKSK